MATRDVRGRLLTSNAARIRDASARGDGGKMLADGAASGGGGGRRRVVGGGDGQLVFSGEAAGHKVTTHLKNLMGSNVVLLNDRNYMLKLQQQVVQEYEVQMDKLEDLRSYKERLRQRKLYVDGLQDTPYMDDSYRRRAFSVGSTRRSVMQVGSSAPKTSGSGQGGAPFVTGAPRRRQGTSYPSTTATPRTAVEMSETTKGGGETHEKTGTSQTGESFSRRDRTISAPAASDSSGAGERRRPSGYWRQRESLLNHLSKDETIKDLYDTADSLLSGEH